MACSLEGREQRSRGLHCLYHLPYVTVCLFVIESRAGFVLWVAIYLPHHAKTARISSGVRGAIQEQAFCCEPEWKLPL